MIPTCLKSEIASEIMATTEMIKRFEKLYHAYFFSFMANYKFIQIKCYKPHILIHFSLLMYMGTF